MEELGATWIRGTLLSWHFVEPEEGWFAFTKPNRRGTDDLLLELSDAGQRVIGFIDVVNEWDHCRCYADPADAFYDPFCDGAAGKHYFYMYCSEESFVNYVKKTVERYDGDDDYGCVVAAPDCYTIGDRQYPSQEARYAIRSNSIKVWEVMNEPDYGNFFTATPVGEPLDWELQIETYFEILKVSHDAIKSVCSDCKVATAGFSHGAPLSRANESGGMWPYLESKIVEMIERGESCFDVFCFHEYIGYKRITETSRVIAEVAPGKEVIITEMGFPSFDSQNENISERLQAQELVRMYTTVQKEGVGVALWFNLHSGEQNDEGFYYVGLLAEDGTKKLAYYSYRLMIDKIGGSIRENVETVEESEGIYVYRFTCNGALIWVAWTDLKEQPGSDSTSYTLDVGEAEALLITETVPDYQSGSEIEESAVMYPDFFTTFIMSATGGELTLTLGANPIVVEIQ
jgi:hypothetical protein